MPVRSAPSAGTRRHSPSLHRGLAIAADTGREPVVLMLTVESVAPLLECGRIAVGGRRRGGRPRAGAAGAQRADAAVGDGRARAARLTAATSLRRLPPRARRGDRVRAGPQRRRRILGAASGFALVAAATPRRALAAAGRLRRPGLARVLPADRPAPPRTSPRPRSRPERSTSRGCADRGGEATPARPDRRARSALLLARGDAPARSMPRSPHASMPPARRSRARHRSPRAAHVPRPASARPRRRASTRRRRSRASRRRDRDARSVRCARSATA